MAVEHIQPKKPFPKLRLEWTNFLLACANCNSCKLAVPLTPLELLLPDRDNTARAFAIQGDGSINVAHGLTPAVEALARRTVQILRLDDRVRDLRDENDVLIEDDRIDDRVTAIRLAGMCKKALLKDLTDADERERIVETAAGTGFFSVWMRVFDFDADMRARFIKRFKGTAHDCFDNSGEPVAQHRAPHTQLAGSGKC